MKYRIVTLHPGSEAYRSGYRFNVMEDDFVVCATTNSARAEEILTLLEKKHYVQLHRLEPKSFFKHDNKLCIVSSEQDETNTTIHVLDLTDSRDKWMDRNTLVWPVNVELKCTK